MPAASLPTSPTAIRNCTSTFSGFRRLRLRVRESELARRVLSGTAWSLFGSVGGKGLTLISSIIVARILGRKGFGELGLIQSTAFSFEMFAVLGLGLTVTKHVAEYRKTSPARAGRIVALSMRIALGTGILAAGLTFGFADQLAATTMASPGLATGIRIAAVALVFAALNRIQEGALCGLEAFRQIARRAIVSGAIGCLLMIAGAMAWGLTGAVWATVLTALATLALNSYTYRQEAPKHNISISGEDVFAEWKTLWRFSLPALLGGLSVSPVNWACNLILVNQPNGYAEMGLLNATQQWRNIVLFVPSVLVGVVLPMLTNLGAAREFKKQRKVMVASVAIAASVGLGAAAIISLMSGTVMAAYGPDFAGGRTVLILQVCAAAIAASISVLGQFLVGIGEMWLLICLQLVWASVNLGLTWAFRARGAEGLSIAYLTAYVVHFATMFTVSYIKMKQQMRPQSAALGERLPPPSNVEPLRPETTL